MRIYLFAILLLFSLSSNGQAMEPEDEPDNLKRFKLSEVSIAGGGIVINQNFGSLSSFRTLAPGSVLLQEDFDVFRSSGYSEGNTVLTGLLGFQILEEGGEGYRRNPTVRIGLGYYGNNLLSKDLNREIVTPYDTLVSAQTNQVYLVDSIVREHYDINYYSGQLRLDLSVIFRTDTKRRFIFFAGAGLTAGYAVESSTEIYYSKTETSRVNYVNTRSNRLNESTPATNSHLEKHSNEKSFNGSIYLPLGFDFKLSNRNEHLSLILLYYEMRPSFDLNNVPELETFAYTSVQHQLGMRFLLD